jgi:hypothetical protein
LPWARCERQRSFEHLLRLHGRKRAGIGPHIGCGAARRSAPKMWCVRSTSSSAWAIELRSMPYGRLQ